MSQRLFIVPAFAMLGLIMLMTACETGPKPGEIDVSFDVEASRDTVYAGENVTFFAEVGNTYGRDADIEWTTTGGDMSEVDGDRVRRITFDEPGEYKVSADLMIDSKRVATDMVSVYVRPVR